MLVNKNEKKGRLALPLLIAVLVLPSLAIPCLGYSLYNLGIEEGDWVEYYVAEADNWEFFTEIKPGDVLRFNVVGTEVNERMYFNGTIAFEVEDAVCDVLLNGEPIQENVTLREMLLYPKGEEHWRDLMPLEENWMETAPSYGIDYSSNITIGTDDVLFSSRFEGGLNAGFKIILHKGTGVTTEFERYLLTGDDDWEYRLEIRDTNVPGIIDPWYVSYWYLIPLSITGGIIGIFTIRRHSLQGKEQALINPRGV